MDNPVVQLNAPGMDKLYKLDMSKPLMVGFGIKQGEKITISYGARFTSAKVDILPDPPAGSSIKYEMTPSEGLVKELLMTTGIKYQVKYTQQKGIEIGPVIGLLLEKKKEGLQPHQFQRFLQGYDEVHGLIFAFSLDSIDWETKGIDGKYYYAEGEHATWRPGKFPLPGAIHRRISLVPQTLKKIVSAIPGDIFNHGYTSDKWLVHQRLVKNEEIGNTLPETTLVKTISQIIEMTNRLGSVYLKPSWGEKGLGVIRLNRAPEGYNAKYTSGPKTISKLILTNDELKKFLSAHGIFSKPYLCQRTINLATFNGKPFDFRVMIMRDGSGNLFCPGAFARVAESDSVTTHIIRGAKPMAPNKVFEVALGLSPEAAKEKERDFINWSLVVARHIDQYYGPVGDIGLDLGVDDKGNFWYIECNAHPDHYIFRGYDALMFETMSKTRLRYASCLAGFPIKQI